MCRTLNIEMTLWLRFAAVAVAVTGCAEFDIKRDRPITSTRSTKPEPEPDLEGAAKRVVSGEDVIVATTGTWLVARRCIWARRDLHACEVVFVEDGLIRAHVPVFDANARGSLAKQAERAVRPVRVAVEEMVGAHRVALSSKLRYGLRDANGGPLYARIVDASLELFNWQFQSLPALAGTGWYFGDAVQTAHFQSPRAPDLLVFELRLRPDAASSLVMFRSDASGGHHFVMMVPPMARTDVPRFPTKEEVLALHEAVGRELDAMPPGDLADALRMRYGWFRIADYLDKPELRLDVTALLLRLRSGIKAP